MGSDLYAGQATRLQIVGNSKPFASNEKRFYVPGVVISCKCPKCGGDVGTDCADEYFSYPMFNTAFDFLLVCKCEHEFTVKLILRLKLDGLGEIAGVP
jgi:hypothetical protein